MMRKSRLSVFEGLCGAQVSSTGHAVRFSNSTRCTLTTLVLGIAASCNGILSCNEFFVAVRKRKSSLYNFHCSHKWDH